MCGEGGIITTNSEDMLNAVKQFRQHGMSGPYQYEGIGYNYRLTDLQAAIANEQLKKVDNYTAARQRNANLFNEGLADLPGIILPKVANNRTHVYHQYTIRIDDSCPLTRNELIDELKNKQIGSAVYYPKSLHTVPHIAAFGYQPNDFPEAQSAAAQVLSLPVHPKVTEADTRTITSVIRGLIGA
jgi:perosamine synthetase